MTNKNNIRVLTNSDKTVDIFFNNKHIQDPVLIATFTKIIGNQHVNLDFELDNDKYIPTNPSLFTSKLDNYFLLQRSLEQRLSYYF